MSKNRPILIVDEDREHAGELASLVERIGFETFTAAGRDEALPLLEQDPRAIILDLMLTKEDGIRLIRDLGEASCDALVVVTGDVDRRILSAAERLARARGLRVAGALPKPIDEPALRRLLDTGVDRTRTGSRGINVQVAQTELLQCLEDGCVDVKYQPKIEVRTLEFVAVEALVRLNHPSRGQLSPAAFLAMAEESGLIGRLTRSVFLRALEQTAEWLREDLRLQIAVNVSPLLLTNLDLPETFADLADRHQIKRENIVLEITESWVNEEPVSALDILTRLRMKGFNLSIDDFGTGYSTMLQLNEIPYSEMKLDQSFTRNATRDREARAIVESSIELGHKLGLKVVAEGIEKQEDWDLISDMGCDEGQGFFIARPMSGDKVPSWVRHWNSCLGRS
ncbi:MAG: EAL domain-containing response regulator [Chromatiales bacterium]|nr:EAL domain-containing response regulator [Chromatiales bacterium]